MSLDRNRMRWNGWGWADHPDPLAGHDQVWPWLAAQFVMPALLATPPRALDSIALPASRVGETARAAFTAILGEDRVRLDARERAMHALGRSYHDLLRLQAGTFTPPDAVLYPRDEDEVLAVLRLAAEREIAIVPFGGGTGMVGGANPSRGGFASVAALDMTGMDRVTGIDLVAGTAEAEAGIAGPDLERQLAAKGMVLGHQPQSFEFSTLGGWIAHHGSGQQSGRYGRAVDWLAGVRVATPQGLLTSGESPAMAAGPDLRHVIIGSEGTLGVITKARLRIRALPAREDWRGWLFRDFASGIAAIREAAREGIPHAMLRLSDAAETRFFHALGELGRMPGLTARLAEALREHRRFDGNAALLIAGFAGGESEVALSRRRFGGIARRLGAMALGTGPGARWREQRYTLPYLRDSLMGQGVGVDMMETAANWSRLPALYTAVRGAVEQTMRAGVPCEGANGIVLCHVGHAHADGASLGFTILFPRNLDAEIAQWRAIRQSGVEAILTAGGTLSHHHGVGEDHLPWMEREMDALGLAGLRAIKRTWDPKGILNPGKLIPPD